MILTKYVLKQIKIVIDGLGYRNYLYTAPQEAQYPFITFFPISITGFNTFHERFEDVRIQFSIFTNSQDTKVLIDIAKALNLAFQNYNNNDGTYFIYCTHVNTIKGPIPNDREKNWMHIMEFDFKCERSK